MGTKHLSISKLKDLQNFFKFLVEKLKGVEDLHNDLEVVLIYIERHIIFFQAIEKSVDRLENASIEAMESYLDHIE